MDPISDMLTRIRNAAVLKKETAVIPYSQLLWNIAKVLEQEKYLKSVTKRGRKTKRTIEVEIFYDENGDPAISSIRRVSSPSRRVYKKAKELFPVKGDVGVSIISSSKGLMTGREAKKQGLGGEILFEVW
ncbi:30S ribosomal protein S8 [Patescibacteria group bacterium]